MNLWDAIKGFFGNPARAATRNFGPKRNPSNAVLFFGMVALASMVAVAAVGKDNPHTVLILWMICLFSVFIALGTWVFYALNPHEGLTPTQLAGYLERMNSARLAGKDHPVIEHVGEPVRDPIALEAEDKASKEGGQ